MTKPVVIAIDGPAGAGKSTVAQKLAQRLEWNYVDSGATYRAAALKILESGVSPESQQEVAEIIARTDIQFRTDGASFRVLLDGRDVTTQIRTSDVSLAAAKVSRILQVRQKLISLQRRLAQGGGVVIEGRDIGTVVFPDSPLKIFLRADPKERARRRLQLERQEGRATTLEQAAHEVTLRDQLDEERTISPLVVASDACEIDSTHLNADAVVEEIIRLARERKLVGEGSKQ